MREHTTPHAGRLSGLLHAKACRHLPVIALLALLAYANTFDASFHFDDTRNIVANSLIRDFSSFLDLSRAKAHPYYNDFKMRPVGYLSFALNYRWHGLEVAGFHTLNLMIHVVNAFLVYLLVVLTGKTPKMAAAATEACAGTDPRRHMALFAALLFVSHPIQTQAVTYIVQRFASLATTFYLTAILAYAGSRLLHLRHRPLAAGSLYLVALVATILAMKTKELAFTIPMVIALYECLFFYRLPGEPGRRLWSLLPFMLTLPIIPLSAIDFAGGGGSVASRLAEQSRILTTMSRTEYLITQLTVIPVYLRVLVLPIGQSLDYDHPLYASLLHGRVLLSALVLLTLFLLGVGALFLSRAGDRRWRLVAFGIFWFYLAMLPESSVIPIVDVLYEHRMYLPSIGLFLALVGALSLLAARLRQRWPGAPAVALVLGWAVVLLLAGATHARNRVWLNETTLWEDVARKSPNKARVRNTLGAIYLDTNQLDRAYGEFRRTLELNPDYWAARVNLGSYFMRKANQVLRESGEVDQALALTGQALASYGQAREQNPDNPMIGTLIDSARRQQQTLLDEKRQRSGR